MKVVKLSRPPNLEAMVQILWGSAPLPGVAVGLVRRRDGDRGILVRLPNGRYVQCSCGGVMRWVPQRAAAKVDRPTVPIRRLSNEKETH